MFEFDNKKPSPIKIWEEINKAELPSSEYPEDLVKVLMWTLVSASGNFEHSKESVSQIVAGEYSVEEFIGSFKQAFNAKYNITINPTEIKFPDGSLEEFRVDVEELRVPILAFTYIFRDIEVSVTEQISKSIWPVTADTLEEFLQNYNTLREGTNLVNNLNHYNINMMTTGQFDSIFNDSEQFRQIFPGSTKKKPMEFISVSDLKTKLFADLKKEVKKGKNILSLPELVYIGDNNE